MTFMKIRLAVPTSGNPCAQTVMALEDIARKAGLPATRYEIAHVSASDSRNRIVFWFLHETDAEYLIMVDHDVIVPPNLLDLARCGKDIVGGPYMIFRPQEANLPFPGVFEREGSGYRPIPNVHSRTGLVQCQAIVTGAICIHRRVLEKIRPAFENGFDEWGRARTEDLVFCEKAISAGFTVWANYAVYCEHLQRVGMLHLMERVAAGIRRVA